VAAGSLKVTWLHAPKHAPWQAKILREMKRRLPSDPDLVWVLSSGTSSVDEVKAIGLTREGIRAAAAAANAHLRASARDRWLIAIPDYHIGGFSIRVRAELCNAKVFRLTKWSSEKFVDSISKHAITLTSLVPTQVFDIVSKELKSPRSLRAVVVGGGGLEKGLYTRARALGWPLLPSYGLTECASQVATASMDSLDSDLFPDFKILRHVDVRLSNDGRVYLRSASVCKWVARGFRDGSVSLEDPLRDDWFPTEDLAEMVLDGCLRVLGRRDDVTKILGTLVPVDQVEQRAREFFVDQGFEGDWAVLAERDGRRGARLILVTSSSDRLDKFSSALDRFNEQLHEPERIRACYWVDRIPKSPLGKVLRAQLRSALDLDSSR
jgi:o-succinylbenzoate---CoA ligase